MSEQLDLFGGCYGGPARKKRTSTQPNGYATRPGSGPAGETCKTCHHCCQIQYTKNFYKCALMKKHWTHGVGSDIRLKSPACRHWKGKDK